MTVTSRVYEIIFEELEKHPEGLGWSEIAKIIKQREPSFHSKTVNGLIWKMPEKYPDRIFKPEKGKFQLLKDKNA
jgi:hypothetical protein